MNILNPAPDECYVACIRAPCETLGIVSYVISIIVRRIGNKVTASYLHLRNCRAIPNIVSGLMS